MSTLNAYSQLTLVELAKRKDPKGELATIAEVLEQENEILLDAPWMVANDDMSHKTVRRISLPAGSWRKLNAGVATEASRTQEVRETIGMLETYAENDKALVDMAPNSASFRNSENVAFMEGLSQTLADALVYGNATTNPEKFDGLATRMGALAATANVIGQGGSGGDTTSIYIVQWGPTKVHLIYPKGHKNFGVEHRDLGEVTKVDANGKLWQVYRDWFGIKVGMVVRDDRCIARLTNIESTGASNTFDEDNLITLLNRMPNSGKGAKLYVNDTVQTQMEIKLKDKSNVYYTPGRGEGLAGEPMIYFRGCAIRKVDQITNAETQVS
jgi:hypothetical protein